MVQATVVGAYRAGRLNNAVRVTPAMPSISASTSVRRRRAMVTVSAIVFVSVGASLRLVSDPRRSRISASRINEMPVDANAIGPDIPSPIVQGAQLASEEFGDLR
jgi:hypothetical protein